MDCGIFDKGFLKKIQSNANIRLWKLVSGCLSSKTVMLFFAHGMDKINPYQTNKMNQVAYRKQDFFKFAHWRHRTAAAFCDRTKCVINGKVEQQYHDGCTVSSPPLFQIIADVFAVIHAVWQPKRVQELLFDTGTM